MLAGMFARIVENTEQQLRCAGDTKEARGSRKLPTNKGLSAQPLRLQHDALRVHALSTGCRLHHAGWATRPLRFEPLGQAVHQAAAAEGGQARSEARIGAWVAGLLLLHVHLKGGRRREACLAECMRVQNRSTGVGARGAHTCTRPCPARYSCPLLCAVAAAASRREAHLLGRLLVGGIARGRAVVAGLHAGRGLWGQRVSNCSRRTLLCWPGCSTQLQCRLLCCCPAIWFTPTDWHCAAKLAQARFLLPHTTAHRRAVAGLLSAIAGLHMDAAQGRMNEGLNAAYVCSCRQRRAAGGSIRPCCTAGWAAGHAAQQGNVAQLEAPTSPPHLRAGVAGGRGRVAVGGTAVLGLRVVCTWAASRQAGQNGWRLRGRAGRAAAQQWAMSRRCRHGCMMHAAMQAAEGGRLEQRSRARAAPTAHASRFTAAQEGALSPTPRKVAHLRGTLHNRGSRGAALKATLKDAEGA